MSELKIKSIKNVYGIVDFICDCVLDQKVIYAPNGVFKSSFARAIYNTSIGKYDEIKDRINDCKTECEITIWNSGSEVKCTEENTIIFPNRFAIGETLVEELGDNIKQLLIDDQYKREFQQECVGKSKEINSNLITYFKGIGIKPKVFYKIVLNREVETLSIKDLEKLYEKINKKSIKQVGNIDVSKFDQKAYEAIDSQEFSKSAKDFIEIIKKKTEEELFDSKFDISNYDDFIKSTEKNNFVDHSKYRGLVIDGKEYFDLDEIKKIYEDAKNRIFESDEVKSSYNELIKNLGSSQEANKIKQKMQEDISFIDVLTYGREEILLSLLISKIREKGNYDNFINAILKVVRVSKEIVQKAKGSITRYEEAIEIYKNRFRPAFDIKIENREDCVIGESVPRIYFIHKRNIGEPKKLDYDNLSKILSSGEKTALDIISFIVKYENITENSDEIAVILDDVVETFDYANRHAFIEYINEMKKNQNIVIVLTHNYEFYRSIRSRTGIEGLCAYERKGVVHIEKNGKINIDLENVFDGIDNEKNLLFCIPYLRELLTMRGNDTSFFDTCLHIKDGTEKIVINDIVSNFTKNINKPVNISSQENYLDYLFKYVDSYDDNKVYDIKEKTLLAMACRLLLEKKIINGNYEKIKGIESNQLRAIRDNYSSNLTDDTKDLMDRTMVSTPEFIHANAFMYEPLIDIDGAYLKKLYDDIKKIKYEAIIKEE